MNNNHLAQASFAVTLFDGGTEAYHGSFSINGLGSLRIDLKSLVPGIAQGTGIVNYDSEHLYFRLSHESKIRRRGCGIPADRRPASGAGLLLQRLFTGSLRGKPSPSPT